MRWHNFGTRIEHVVAPGGWLTQRGTHLAGCPCRCADVQTCPECGKPASPAGVKGRWDEQGGCTALPFDPVFVSLSCGCEFGDESLAWPKGREARP